MGLMDSLYYRARYWVQNQERMQILKRNQLVGNEVDGVSQTMIEGMETLKNYVQRANVVLDIGAHHGLFSKAANGFFDFDQTIFFEPNQAMIEHIERNSSKFPHQIQNVALSDEEGEVTFYLHENETMNSIVKADEMILKEEFPYDNPEKMQTTTVPTTTLDKAIASLSLDDAIFLLKIDTQGNELNVLKHGMQVLQQTEVCFIEYMFLSPYHGNFTFYELVAFMDQQGFDCQGALSILKRPSKKVSAVDFLFVKRQQ